MSRSKAQLVKTATGLGIKNPGKMPYRQLDMAIRTVKKTQSLGDNRMPASTKTPKSYGAGGSGGTGVGAVGELKPKLPKRPFNYGVPTMTVTTHINRVELRKGLLRWYYVVKGSYGEIMSVSQKYFSRYNAERAAVAIAKANDYGYGVRQTKD